MSESAPLGTNSISPESVKGVFGLHAENPAGTIPECPDHIDNKSESTQEWANEIFADVETPDARLRRRIVKVAAAWAAQPGVSLNRACGAWPEAKGAYRLFGNDRVTAQALGESVFQYGVRQCEDLNLIFAVQDTTTLMFAHHPGTTGMGPITSERTRGMLMHNTLAVRPDGTPLGLLDCQAWVRESIGSKTRGERLATPREEKESYKWIKGIIHSNQRVKQCFEEGARPRIIHIMDREGDIHEVFTAIRNEGNGAIIRSAWNRRVSEEHKYLRQQAASVKIGGKVIIDVPRKKNQPARKATLEIRWTQVTLAPSMKLNRTQEKLYVVWAHEPAPPKDIEALDWLLLTTEPVKNLHDASWIIDAYKLRWRVEEFHLTLKSGCKIEAHQFKSAERIMKVLMVLAAIAVRILIMTYLARTEPDSPCTFVLSDAQWRALWTRIHGKRPLSSHPPPTIYQAIMWIGRLGGHLGRRRDGMPGVRTLWKGWRDLELIAALYEQIMIPP